ncbi:hypothetical protein P1A20_14070 [Staphylococcus equorum]|uniref:TcaA NTF2-like domain-containing protein n=1 Tax=Staphylococcus equorum TaxID=246432 RepID=UPI002554D08D|nr:hypothetical protein [Staphylococcus equorum]MDK9847702.1 hypothetical protein [Staphylococcus equorum]
MTEKQEESNTSKRKLIIIYSFVIIGLFIIFYLVYFLIHKNDAISQIDDFRNAVNNNKYNYIANTLSNNEEVITEKDAKHFVNYVKRTDNKDKFSEEINSIKKNIKSGSNNESNYGSITDRTGQEIINISKNGKKFFFIDKLTFKPNLFDIYVKEYNNQGVYDFKDSNKVKGIAGKNSVSKIGTSFVGKYNVKADKTIKESLVNGVLTGKLKVDTDNKDNKNRVIAQDDFYQTWFKVNLKNKNYFKESDTHIVINDKKEDYNSNTVYGKYYNPTNLSIYAVGIYEGKKFKSNSLKLRRNYKSQPQNINLKFGESELEDYKKESKSLKDKSKSYIKDYTKALNKAYNKSDYKYVSKFIKDNSELEKQLKKTIMSKEKVKFEKVKVNSIKRDKSKLTITLNKKNGNDFTTTKYFLDYKESEKEFIIEKSKEI